MEDNGGNTDLFDLRESVQGYIDDSLEKHEAGPDYVSLSAVVHCHEHTFVLNVGDGKQSTKWLALNAQRRYQNACKTHGRQRHRDPRGGKFSGSFMPINVEEVRF
jgi:hypothetical protein